MRIRGPSEPIPDQTDASFPAEEQSGLSAEADGCCPQQDGAEDKTNIAEPNPSSSAAAFVPTLLQKEDEDATKPSEHGSDSSEVLKSEEAEDRNGRAAPAPDVAPTVADGDGAEEDAREGPLCAPGPSLVWGIVPYEQLPANYTDEDVFRWIHAHPENKRARRCNSILTDSIHLIHMINLCSYLFKKPFFINLV